MVVKQSKLLAIYLLIFLIFVTPTAFAALNTSNGNGGNNSFIIGVFDLFGENFFKTDHASTLDLTKENVTLDDKQAVIDALAEYEELSAEAKAELSDEKALLDALLGEIELQEAIAVFEVDYHTVLGKDTDSITTDDKQAVEDALAAYAELDPEFQERLEDEKALLDDLLEEIELQEEVAGFLATHDDALVLTIETVNVDDKAIVEAALAAYGLLSDQAKALLEDEKALLLDLLNEIIAFENSAFFDFEDFPASNNVINGEIVVGGRTWFGTNIYIANDPGFDVWIGTRSLALNNNASFASSNYFLNGIDKITLFHGALNFNNGQSFQFIVEYELASNPGVWLPLQLNGSDVVIDVISGDPLTFEEIPVNIDEAVNIRFTANISDSSYINLDDIRVFERVVPSVIEANTFRAVYSTALALSVETVDVSDKTTVETALTAWDALSVDAQTELTAEKALLDDLLSAIELIEATNAVVVAETTYQQVDLNEAQGLVSALPSGSAKDALQARLDAVQTIIDAVDGFLAAHASVLTLTPQTVQVSDKTAVETALADYFMLPSEARANLTAERDLLEALLIEINEQIPTEDQVSAFLVQHAYVLGLSVETVSVSDKPLVALALSQYEVLSAAAKAELTVEKALLDDLLFKAELIEATNAVEVAETSNQQADVDIAQALVDTLALGPERDALQTRLDAVQDIIDANESASVMALIAELPTINEMVLSDETQVIAARVAYDALTEVQQGLVLNASTLNTAEAFIEDLQIATALVISAEASTSQADVDAAFAAVNSLPNSMAKTALIDRLNAVQDTIDVATAQALISDYFANNSVTLPSFFSTNATRRNAFLAQANSLIDGLDVNITITSENRINWTNTVYTISITKNDVTITLVVSVTFTF